MNWRRGLTRAWVVGVVICFVYQFYVTNVPLAAVAVLNHYPTQLQIDAAQAAYDNAVAENAKKPPEKRLKSIPKDPILQRRWPITSDIAGERLQQFALSGVALPLLLPPGLMALVYLLMAIAHWVMDGFHDRRRRR